MTRNIETKAFEFEIKDAESNGTIRGYASTFGNVDLGFDVVDKGAFKKTIKENRGVFPILSGHNPDKQIGWNVRAEEDEKGLLVEGKIDLNVQEGREKYSLAKTAMEHGGKMGLSIGYMTIKGEPDRENPRIRRIKEVKLFEYSIVTFPMNTMAMVTAAKSMDLKDIDQARMLIKQLNENGISTSVLKEALSRLEVADDLEDPGVIAQSIDALIKSFRAS